MYSGGLWSFYFSAYIRLGIIFRFPPCMQAPHLFIRKDYKKTEPF